jgi:hypothetical protein
VGLPIYRVPGSSPTATDRDDLGGIQAHSLIRPRLLEPRQCSGAAAGGVFQLLRNLFERPLDFEGLASRQQHRRRGHLETAAAGVAAERACDLARFGLPLEMGLVLISADRVAMYGVLEPLELRFELIDSPLESVETRFLDEPPA